MSGNPLSMPTHHSLGSDDGYGVEDARTATIKPNEQSAVDPTQFAPRNGTLQHERIRVPCRPSFAREQAVCALLLQVPIFMAQFTIM
jgi:hypothetical protein